ncbi:hypothetical protein DFA_05329 [Cavenderia fasciculata]|uniref:Uncharacterized protein n=1 Tax=Cavenderia fasciculata TaxID=261658 RepID=F4PKX5_CACFS|nr:uncharacterized protein DFA_05329 [Cavenderia fasciculata]EGG23197.1 hypothetical protein DFA_05329 [Cavenderia fasciculata]|eukprot:XP_004361048.1 hypothetical protein DFA_05329 [Cavenderia fasciculata]
MGINYPHPVFSFVIEVTFTVRRDNDKHNIRDMAYDTEYHPLIADVAPKDKVKYQIN